MNKTFGGKLPSQGDIREELRKIKLYQ